MKKIIIAAVVSISLPAGAYAGCSLGGSTDFKGNTTVNFTCQLW